MSENIFTWLIIHLEFQVGNSLSLVFWRHCSVTFCVAVFLLRNPVLFLSFAVLVYLFSPHSGTVISRSFVSKSFIVNCSVCVFLPSFLPSQAVYLMSHFNRRFTFLSLKIFLISLVISFLPFSLLLLSRPLISCTLSFQDRTPAFHFHFHIVIFLL